MERNLLIPGLQRKCKKVKGLKKIDATPKDNETMNDAKIDKFLHNKLHFAMMNSTTT